MESARGKTIDKRRQSIRILNAIFFIQKYWPKPDADPLKVTALASGEKLSKYSKQPEDIKRLETNRSKDNHIFECPADSSTPKSNKSVHSIKSQPMRRK